MDEHTILVVDDERNVREGLDRFIRKLGYRVQLAEGLGEARKLVQATVPTVLLLDIRLKDGDGLTFLEEFRTRHPAVPVIMATAFGDSDRTIRAMKEGAFEYLTKPFDLDAIEATLARAVRSIAPVQTSALPRNAEQPATPSMIGKSARMLEIWKSIGRAASSEVPVLITGESGTGKELVARAIHNNSSRKSSPFVAVNIAALPSALIESELFGHEKGAFTGALARREGRFEAASNGTIFLDEIGDLDVALQSKLLRVLQDGTFERIGSQTPLTSHARVIAATSKPVDPKDKNTTLRIDLFYRLGVVRIEVPPLRDRKNDIPLLVEAHLERLGAQSQQGKRALTEQALQKLLAYHWPGNVRELLHVVERACVMSPAAVLDESLFDIEPSKQDHPLQTAEPADLDLRRAVEQLERQYIIKAIQRAGGNRAEAARLLGIARPHLYAKMKDLAIDPGDPRKIPSSS